MSLLQKDSKFDLDKKPGPQFERELKNTQIKDLFESNKVYRSPVHKRNNSPIGYGPQGRGPETKRIPKNPTKYLDNLPR